jgi:type II secretory pathway pseudopilin PulG
MKTNMKYKSTNGFTLVESVVGMVMFAAVVAGLAPLIIISRTFAMQSDSRVGAIAVAQQIMDSLRQADAATLPSSGTVTTLPSSDSIANLSYKGKTYSATITYCENTTYCNTNTRHLKVKIYNDGNTATTPTRTCAPGGRTDQKGCPIYQLESVYARLQ